jgi:hypothetical protein
MLPETFRVVIPIKWEFGASVGFIHKKLSFLFAEVIVALGFFFHLRKTSAYTEMF